MKRRVVITGCGIVSPLGGSPDEMWDALQQRRSGVATLERLPNHTMPVKSGAEIKGFRGHIDDFGPLPPPIKKTIRKGLKVMCREIQLGVAAAQRGLQHAAIDLTQCQPERVGVVFGADYIMTIPEEFAEGVAACQADGDFDFSRWAETGMPKVTPLWLLKYLPNMPACHVAIYNDLRGPNNSITMREASANLAIAEGMTTIQRGAADQVVAGATGSRLHPLRTVHTILQEQMAAGDADPATLSRPFDRNRIGMVPGEGAAVVVLEELEAARQRGARILGEVTGYGASTVCRPDGLADRRKALANALGRALEMAHKTPAEIGHVNAHGLATETCDREEAAALADVWGTASSQVPVVAPKSYFGNLGAASGVVELTASLWAMQQGSLFSTLNYETPDPNCPLNVVTDPSTSVGDSFVNLNVTPQGQASVVLVERI